MFVRMKCINAKLKLEISVQIFFLPKQTEYDIRDCLTPQAKQTPHDSTEARDVDYQIMISYEYHIWSWVAGQMTMAGQTGAEGLVKLGVETPRTRPGWGYLKATQHPGLVWGERRTGRERRSVKILQSNRNLTLRLIKNIRLVWLSDIVWESWEESVQYNLGWSYWRGKQEVNWRSQGCLPLLPDTAWQSARLRKIQWLRSTWVLGHVD